MYGILSKKKYIINRYYLNSKNYVSVKPYLKFHFTKSLHSNNFNKLNNSNYVPNIKYFGSFNNPDNSNKKDLHDKKDSNYKLSMENATKSNEEIITNNQEKVIDYKEKTKQNLKNHYIKNSNVINPKPTSKNSILEANLSYTNNANILNKSLDNNKSDYLMSHQNIDTIKYNNEELTSISLTNNNSSTDTYKNKKFEFNQFEIDKTNSFILKLLEEKKNSFLDETHNINFNEFLVQIESLMKNTHLINQGKIKAKSNILAASTNSPKPLQDICDLYLKFTNQYGFDSEILTYSLIAIKNTVLIRRMSCSAVAFDYSDWELIFSRKLYFLVDDLKYGITQKSSFMKYEEFVSCFNSLRLIGYKNTSLLELILQRINFDSKNLLFKEFISIDNKDNNLALNDSELNYSIFEENCFGQSYKEKYGFWPGEGKFNFYHKKNIKYDLIQDSNFIKNINKLMNIKTNFSENDNNKVSFSNSLYEEFKNSNSKNIESNIDMIELHDDISDLLNSIKDIKDIQSSIINNVETIIEQFEKIKFTFYNNPEVLKRSPQLRYDMIILQNKLAELGLQNTNIANSNKQSQMEDCIKILKEFMLFYFNDIFNIEIDDIADKIDQVYEVNYDYFDNITNNNLYSESVYYLGELLNEINEYSLMKRIDINKDDYYNNNFFKGNISNNTYDKKSLVEKGIEDLSLNDSLQYTISAHIKRHWFDKITNNIYNNNMLELLIKIKLIKKDYNETFIKNLVSINSILNQLSFYNINQSYSRSYFSKLINRCLQDINIIDEVNEYIAIIKYRFYDLLEENILEELSNDIIKITYIDYQEININSILNAVEKLTKLAIDISDFEPNRIGNFIKILNCLLHFIYTYNTSNNNFENYIKKITNLIVDTLDFQVYIKQMSYSDRNFSYLFEILKLYTLKNLPVSNINHIKTYEENTLHDNNNIDNNYLNYSSKDNDIVIEALENSFLSMNKHELSNLKFDSIELNNNTINLAKMYFHLYDCKPNIVFGCYGLKVGVFFDYNYNINEPKYFSDKSYIKNIFKKNYNISIMYINPLNLINFDLINGNLKALDYFKETKLILSDNIHSFDNCIKSLVTKHLDLVNIINYINNNSKFSNFRDNNLNNIYSNNYNKLVTITKVLSKEMLNAYNSFNMHMLSESITSLENIKNSINNFIDFSNTNLSEDFNASFIKLIDILKTSINDYINELSLQINKLPKTKVEFENNANIYLNKRIGIDKLDSCNTINLKNNTTLIINNKFLWTQKYSYYSDWDFDLKKFYDKYNYNEIIDTNDPFIDDNFKYLASLNPNKFYFNNHKKGDRFVPKGIFPNSEIFRKINVPDNLTVYNASFNNNKNMFYNFCNTPIEIRLKVNLLNIVQAMKEKLTDQEIMSFICKFDFVRKLKQEHIDYFKNKNNISNGKSTYNLLLQRKYDSYLEFLINQTVIDPRIDDFSKTVLLEEEKQNFHLKYSPEMNFKEREDALVNKFEKWLELNTDTDDTSDKVNKVYYNIDSKNVKDMLLKVKKEAVQRINTLKELYSNSNNKENFELINEMRKISERNIIIGTILFKNNLINHANTNDLDKSLLLDEQDLEYIKLIKLNLNNLNSISNVNNFSNIKQTITDMSFEDLSEDDVYSLESLSDNVTLIKDNTNIYKSFSINEIVFELNNFIDNEYIEKVLNNTNKSLYNSSDSMLSESKYSLNKVEVFDKLKMFETIWRNQKKLSQEDIDTTINMFFVNKNNTQFYKNWKPIYSKYLNKEINELNNFDRNLELINILLRNSDRELYNLIHWPDQLLINNVNLKDSYKEIETENLSNKNLKINELFKDIKHLDKNEIKTELTNYINFTFIPNILLDVVNSYLTIRLVNNYYSNIISKETIDLLNAYDYMFGISNRIKQELINKFGYVNKEQKISENTDKDIVKSLSSLENNVVTDIGAKKFNYEFEVRI